MRVRKELLTYKENHGIRNKWTSISNMNPSLKEAKTLTRSNFSSVRVSMPCSASRSSESDRMRDMFSMSVKQLRV